MTGEGRQVVERNFFSMLATVIVAAAAAWLALALAPALDAANAVTKVSVGSFASPIYATAPPGAERRLFVVERGGKVRVLVDGEKRSRAFLNITDLVDVTGEGGLLSVAFAPDYAQSRRFYVFYTRPPAAGRAHGPIRVDEFRRSAGNPNVAVEGSRRKVIEIPHPDYGNHLGGTLQFGPDELLYISTGDGGGSGDPERNAQDLSSLLGKILRINPRAGGGNPYRIPSGNPFAGAVEGRDAIFALGLRNPFRFSFDRLTGDLAIGDVGQAAVEEVNFGTIAELNGANFGWNCFEGSEPFEFAPPGCELSFGTHEPPVHQRFHEAHGVCSITGGVVVRHPSLASLAGDYVYGDYCQEELRAVRLSSAGATTDRGIGVDVPSVVAFGEDGLGRVHAVSLNGRVYRLED